MRVDQVKPLRWLFAELIVIVLGILIAFQVEDWREERQNKFLEVKAFQEVLSDLDSIELTLLDAIRMAEESTPSAVKLIGLIQSGEGGEDDFLESIGALNVYMIGVAEGTYAYDGLLAAGRFAAVENSDLTKDMRLFFSIRKPWIYSLNAMHVEHYDNLVTRIYLDVRQIPDLNFSSNLKSKSEISVPIDEFLNDPQLMDDLLDFVRRSERLKDLFRSLVDDIKKLREDINLHLGSLRPSS
ncbi:MAG: hypothetical protein ABJN62_07115 [Halioglobus sp.]